MKDILRIGLLIAVVALAVVVVWQSKEIAALETHVADLHVQLTKSFIRVRRVEVAVEKSTGEPLAKINDPDVGSL